MNLGSPISVIILLEAFPVFGSILARKFSEGLVNLGEWHGMKTEQKCLIIRKGGLKLKPSALEFLFKPEDILGTLTVDRTDESLSSGIIEPDTFFDSINPGDLIIFAPDEETD